MGLFIIYGINAVGKDTTALAVAKKFKKVLITSESRILMYHLKLIKSIDATTEVERESYRRFENADRGHIKKIYLNDYPALLKKVTSQYDLVILLSHLVFALYIGKKKVQYLTEIEAPRWLIEMCDGVVMLTAKPKDILVRRIADTKELKRDRVLKLEQIKFHQELCNKKFKLLQKIFPYKQIRMIKNNNDQLDMAVKEIISLINKN